MVQLTKLNNEELYINASLIETIEETPDTVITTTTGHKLIVREPAREVVQRIIAYYRSIGVSIPKSL